MNPLAWIFWAIFSALWIGFWLFFFARVKISLAADATYHLIVFGVPVAVLAGTAAISAALAARRARTRSPRPAGAATGASPPPGARKGT